MKKIILLANFMLLMMASAIIAQDTSEMDRLRVRREQERNALAAALASSPAARELNDKRFQDSGAILRAAATGDQSLVPYLKLVATKEGRSSIYSDAFMAHVALVKLGDAAALTEVFAEVQDRAPRIREAAIKKLTRAETKQTYQKLYSLLDDTVTRQPFPKPGNDEIYSTNNAIVVIMELSEAVDNPPVDKNHIPSLEDIPLWKEWFVKNKRLISK